MSFREKHLWISLIASAGAWGWYFAYVVRRAMDGGLTSTEFAGDVSGVFAFSLIVVVAIEVVLTFIATATTPKVDKTGRDEREIAAALRGSHVALMALITLVICLAIAVYFAGLVGGNLVDGRGIWTTDVNALVLLANGMVAMLVLAEMIRAGVTLMLLRGLR